MSQNDGICQKVTDSVNVGNLSSVQRIQLFKVHVPIKKHEQPVQFRITLARDISEASSRVKVDFQQLPTSQRRIFSATGAMKIPKVLWESGALKT